MVKIKTGLKSLSPTKLQQQAALHLAKLKANSVFDSLTPLRDKIEGEVNVLQSAITKQQTIALAVQEAAADIKNTSNSLIVLLNELAHEVSILAKTDESLIYEAGFEPISDRVSHNTIERPINLLLSESNKDGELKGKVKAVRGAKSYLHQISYDISDATAWQAPITTTRSSFILTNLISGNRVWVRVAAIGTPGQSGWSDVASRIVP